ncbi:hypothetical protein C7402_1247 [Paraburkholderia unamae]|uniref:Uncharacterized protein n=1 Tax=Paraburkholderia unamae TaxID=219649 RepID=A0ABX5KDN3_9BURK|nr:hypothetical protein C7402_1247 [Paraburkholderia unamae]
MADQSGNVKERRHAENRAALAQADEIAVRLRVEREIAVRADRAFGAAARSRGVDEHGGIVGREGDRCGLATLRGPRRPQEIASALACSGCIPLRDEHARVVARLHGARAGGEHVWRGLAVGLDALDHFAHHFAFERVVADQHARLRIVEQQPQFARAVHRVDRHHHRARFPDAEQRDHKLRHVLQIERDAIAASHLVVVQHAGYGVAPRIERLPVEPAVEVEQRAGVWRMRERRCEDVEAVAVFRLRVRVDAGVIQLAPWVAFVGVHVRLLTPRAPVARAAPPCRAP